MTWSVSVATAEQQAWYNDRLYPLQDRVLRLAGSYGEALVLTGGTALARHYFQHRYSDDLDLFSTAPRIRELAREVLRTVANDGIPVETTIDQPGFVRAFVGESIRLKIDFAADLPRLDAPLRTKEGYYVHTLRDIGANKIVAFEDRAEIKDVLDLMRLVGALQWENMVADADAKRVPLDYDALSAVLAQDVSGDVLAAQPIAKATIEAFLKDFRAKLLETVQKKTLEATAKVDTIVADLLWDAPPTARNVNASSRPILERRAKQLPLPARRAVLAAISRL